MAERHILWTGLATCYDDDGHVVSCPGSGQDAESKTGISWSGQRYEHVDDNLVRDTVTGLIWTRDAGLFDYPVSWDEALRGVKQMNTEIRFGRQDWRMPNRRELRSLIDHSRSKPALTPGHPFQNVFLGWYWTSTTANIARSYAWHVHMEGGRMFYGNKDGYGWLWPVCGASDVLACTGAAVCYDERGNVLPCGGTGQDAALRAGIPWPAPRFSWAEESVCDELTGLVWSVDANLGRGAVSWSESLEIVRRHATETGRPWRLPTINELESIVDAATHAPALPAGHPFADVQEAYWSSTTSSFETDWAYALYLHKGAVGVGFKKNRDFSVWAVL